MTINETSFFRDSRPFELLRTDLLPKLIEARRHVARPALLERRLLHRPGGLQPGDDAAGALSHAGRLEHSHRGHRHQRRGGRARQAGRYHRIEINRGLPARFVVRYFDHSGENWVVKQEVRKMCNFRQANLCGPRLPFNRAGDRFDVIFLRNVMLYFSQETRRSLLTGIHRLLAPDGFLFLGSTEQPADPSIWTAVLAGGTCHFKPRQPS